MPLLQELPGVGIDGRPEELVNPTTPMGTATPGHVAVLAVLHLPAYVLATTVLPAFLGVRASD